ncbi:hypothetical protein ROA7450_03376 [Roseovarius albus]|uniref:Uncharacterized protein n=1 Tax=Roseovarius albus TaxID=1247867 RepID=A0A1X6ZXH5_9RHOB|nr:hypothetical protein ROA7450_03376 [Roseovarius albus]
MTDRDYGSIRVEEIDGSHVRMGISTYSWQNVTRIRRRAIALGRNYAKGWHCLHCGNLMPEWKRVDAKYCKEGCRKMAARQRR